MPVGNDVVDLQDPANRPAAIHPRFDHRVFTPAERSLIGDARTDDAHLVRWTLWAAKESVLKLVRQVGDDVPFHPREFVVALRTEDRAEVTYAGATYSVHIDLTADRVHAIATDAADPDLLLTGVESLRTPEDASVQARERAAAAVAARLGLEPGEVTIEGSIPRAYRNGAKLSVEISLSHDGRYVAHAFRETGEPALG